MKRLSLWMLCLTMVLVHFGCQESVVRYDPEKLAAARKQFLLEEEPEGVEGVLDVQENYQSPREVVLGQQFVGRRCRMGRRLVLQPQLLHLERSRHVEDRLPTLDRHHSPRREALAIPDRVDLVDDRPLRVPHPQEVRVQRVRGAIRRDGLDGGRERLPENLPTEDLPPPQILGLAAEEVLLDPLERQQVQELAEHGSHRRMMPDHQSA